MKVTPEDCEEIRRLSEETNLTQSQIGERVAGGVTQFAVGYHARGECSCDNRGGLSSEPESIAQSDSVSDSESEIITEQDARTVRASETQEDEAESGGESETRPQIDGWNDDEITEKSALDLLNERVDISLNGGGPITVFDAARAWRRRRAIEILADNPDGIDLGDLADEIAAEEHGGAENVNATERKRVYVGLYQHHIEKLEKAGLAVVEDERTNHLRPTEATPIAAEWIRDGENVADAIRVTRRDSGVIGRIVERVTGVLSA